jgi:hypothetical protein
MSDHIQHDTKTGQMYCGHCGFKQALKMPAPIDDVLTAMDQFLEAHKACRAPAPETVMSEYIKGFDAGYGFVLHEIEQYAKNYKDKEACFAFHELLQHLRLEKDPK